MSFKPRPQRPRHKPRPRSRPRLFLPAPLPQTSVTAQWSPQQLMLEELVQVYPLPQVVQCRTPVLPPEDRSPLPFQLDKTIVLASQRTARHLLARIVVYDDRSGTFNESPDSVVIPEDYEGHFLRLHSRTTKDKSQVQTLDTIAHDDTPAFLNLANITSFPVNGPRGRGDQSRLIYTVGNVFLVDEPMLDPAAKERAEGGEGGGGAATANSTTAGSKNGKNGKGNGLMRCLDERGVAVMVPTDQIGEMVRVQKSADNQPKLSVKSKEMIANEHFPLLARFAYGKRNPRLTNFTKLFTLLDSFEENSIVACILDGPSTTLMEVPVTSTLQFQVALNSQELLEIPRLRNALHECLTRGRDLSRDIKYKYKFSHRVQETSRRMMKKREGDLPSATVRTRLVVTETYVYI